MGTINVVNIAPLRRLARATPDGDLRDLKRLTVRLDQAEVDWLDGLGSRWGCSRAAAGHRALAFAQGHLDLLLTA